MVLASHALECVGICHSLGGDPAQADRFMLQALGLALQSGDDSTVQRRLSNLFYMAQTRFDDHNAEGDAGNATQALQRCTLYAAQGERLARRAGVYEQCLWRSNRAGLLLRRGLLVEAIADYDAVNQEAERHGWIVLARNARLDRALALRLRGRPNDAIAALRSLIRDDADSDTCDVNLRAHEALQELLQAAGRQREAAGLAPAIQRIVGRRDAERATAIALLPRIGAVVDAAIAEADRLRVDAEAERAREHANDLRNAAFLNRP